MWCPAKWLPAVGISFFVLFFVDYKDQLFRLRSILNLPHSHYPGCPQVPPLLPSNPLWNQLSTSTLSTHAFQVRAAQWLAGAVQIETESYDDMPTVEQDPRPWDKFARFNDYLATVFPNLHSNLSKQTVNKFGLIYTWHGSNTSLKPILFMAHSDVVPVDNATRSSWTYPPYSGHFDGTYVWGRGSCDDKSGLISIMAAVEVLLEASFQPTRTVILAFGFDEEASGHEGAKKLAAVLLRTLGPKSIAFIIDEGTGYKREDGVVFATPGIAEKGYLDVKLNLITPGGHSSYPPRHTGIGLMSKIISHIEDHPFPVQLTRKDVHFATLQCQAQHNPSLDSSLRRLIQKSATSDSALRKLESQLFQDRDTGNMVGTTQAVDLIQGGSKVNSLPENVWAVVNHRISTESSVEDVRAHYKNELGPFVEKLGLTFFAFGDDFRQPITEGSLGRLLALDAFESALEPAPRTPTSIDSKPFALLSGTIRSAYHEHRTLPHIDERIFVSPGMDAGNTDTQFYWNLTEHIFRYGHMDERVCSIHTVDEAMPIDSFVEMIKFFLLMILNADEGQL
ncbi:carboxypeptidase S [Flagelloscypha sp. PMI_526]|nr:carboxypeptidase S [Flagelloscypha sp. PMI_526]